MLLLSPLLASLPLLELPLDAIASELYSAFSVAVPALPSAVRPFFCWKAVTAACVAAPKEPSALPERYPNVLSRFCSARTASPWEPFSSVSPIEDTGEEDFAAEAEYSAFSVSGPAMPSSHRPEVFFWNAFTAASVAPPKVPSALPAIQPNSISRFCSVVTFLPVRPTFR